MYLGRFATDYRAEMFLQNYARGRYFFLATYAVVDIA